MLRISAPIDYYALPDEKDACYQRVLAELDGAQHSIRQFMFGLTDRGIAGAYLRAHTRGIPVFLLLDFLQGRDNVESTLLHQMIAQGFPVGNIRFTESLDHQYSHSKEAVLDVESPLPDQVLNGDDARAQGYPRIITGSTNFSSTAFEQTNDLLVIPSRDLANDAMTRFTTLWNYAVTNEARFQLAA